MSLSQQVLKEFIDNCREGDLIKARLVLDHCDQIDATAQTRILYELNKCEDSFALPLMLFIAVRHQEALEKHPMLAESIREKAALNPELFREQLRRVILDETEDYVRLVTQLNIREAGPVLLPIIDQISDHTLQEKVIQFLTAGNPVESVPVLERFVDSDVQTLSDAAIDVLGQIRTSAAIHILNRLLISNNAHTRNRAKYRLIEIGRDAADVVADNLNSSDVDLLIHSLNILQAIGDKSTVSAVRRLINNKPADANVRFAAYEALARLPLRSGDYVLAAGLTDSDRSIRLAAARAIDEHLDESLLRGITNMLEANDNEAERVARAIVESHSRHLVVQLMKGRFFRQFLVQMLANTPDASLRAYHLDLLKSSGNQTVIDEIQGIRNQTGIEEKRGQICAVDDSRMILKVYQSILNELGFEPVLFDKPAEFLNWLADETPDLVFTDLNMPDITGIDLIEAVREHFSAIQLPIIMVTTQNEETDFEAARQAGVSDIISKPFDLEKIENVLAPFFDSKNP